MNTPKKEKDARFGKFGAVSFTTLTKVNDFVDYLQDGKVMATRCKACNTTFFPPRADCCHCLSSDMAWREVAGSGKLVSYSCLKFAPIGFDGDVPYSIALLDYGDYRVFGRIDSNLSLDDIKIGMPMMTVANKLPNGQINYVFKKA